MHGLRRRRGLAMGWAKSKKPAMSPEEREAAEARNRDERRVRLAAAAMEATKEARRWLVAQRAFDPAESVPVQMRQLARYRDVLAHGEERKPSPDREVCVAWR